VASDRVEALAYQRLDQLGTRGLVLDRHDIRRRTDIPRSERWLAEVTLGIVEWRVRIHKAFHSS
jgi:hypothetical protein